MSRDILRPRWTCRTLSPLRTRTNSRSVVRHVPVSCNRQRSSLRLKWQRTLSVRPCPTSNCSMQSSGTCPPVPRKGCRLCPSRLLGTPPKVAGRQSRSRLAADEDLLLLHLSAPMVGEPDPCRNSRIECRRIALWRSSSLRPWWLEPATFFFVSSRSWCVQDTYLVRTCICRPVEHLSFNSNADSGRSLI